MSGNEGVNMNNKVIKTTMIALGVLVLLVSIFSIVSLVSAIQYRNSIDLETLNKEWKYDGKALELSSSTSTYVLGIGLPIVVIAPYSFVAFRTFAKNKTVPMWPAIVIAVVTLLVFAIMIYGIASSKSNATDFEAANLSKGGWRDDFDFTKLEKNGVAATQDQFDALIKSITSKRPSYDAAIGYVTIATMIITTVVAGYTAYSAKKAN